MDGRGRNSHARAIGASLTAHFVYAANTPAAIKAAAPQTRLELMLPLLSDEHPRADFDQLKRFFRANDMIVFGATDYPLLRPFKNMIDGGIGTWYWGTGGITITTLLPGIKNVTGDIEYITYDYEPAFCPEFTSNQAQSLVYFDALQAECANYGKNLLITPPYLYTSNWNWGTIAESVNFILLQVQNLQTGAKVPDSIKPSALGYTLTEVATDVGAAIKAANANCKFYLQLDAIVTDIPSYIIDDVHTLEDISDVDGVALWYNPETASRSSELPTMLSVLESI